MISRTDQRLASKGPIGLGLVSAREAARILAPLGLNRTRTQTVLDSGLAGEPVRTPIAHLYDTATVLGLANRSEVAWAERHLLGGHTLLVARGAFDTRRSTDELVRTFLSTAGFGLAHQMTLAMRATHFGPLPLVMTVCGFVVCGAEVSGLGPGSRVRAPGPWFERVRERRLSTGPGRAMGGPRAPAVAAAVHAAWDNRGAPERPAKHPGAPPGS